eukprot:CAMPEP_0172487918 /NCGR_PEP_ID=MMETSP1066-20121228/17222_1 /TAXON_ID=671091 /ORGANISM="Coscinodiscus wailesii, Strain CCMP2513" /LENGTH=440 /DNA_ID=CAMNT_0013254825 /DNA_START=571 /DNA_END=1893 /DNA_ORIENTATION=+
MSSSNELKATLDPTQTPANENGTSKNLILPQSLPENTSKSITHDPSIPSVSTSAVLGESSTMPERTPQCAGFDFNTASSSSSKEDTLLSSLLSSYATMGFQATNLSLAIDQINKMRQWRLSHQPFNPALEDESLRDLSIREKIRARIFLAFTSNQISSGQREVIRYLVQHKMVDVVVTTAGGVEEDLIKCLQPTFIGDFKYDGKALRKKGLNRIGNLIVPYENYRQFGDWLGPILHKMHDEQDAAWNQWRDTPRDGKNDDVSPPAVWTPSTVIARLGKEINNEDSVLYWAQKNGIPIFCPALTDGSIGDALYFHSYNRPSFHLDIATDVRRINDLALRSHATGMIILGGGVAKHHTCNANIMRNGADWSVYVTTAQEFDGSDAGAAPDEAVSWGTIGVGASPVKVCADASLVFPLIVSETFGKDVEEWRRSVEGCVCWIG